MNKEKLLLFWYNVTYYLYYVPRSWLFNIKWYISNRIRFNKILKEWRPWDYGFQIDLFKFGIQQLCNYIEKYGNEVDKTRMKKVSAMKQLIAELSRDIEWELDEKVYGFLYKEFNERLYEDENETWHSSIPEKEAKKLHKQFVTEYTKELNKHYNTIFYLIKGQNLTNKDDEQWEEMFDGSGIKGWWS